MNFELHPPPDAGPVPAGTPAPTAAELAAAAEPINILIVDDEPKNLVALETVLDDPSYRLVRAESADEALLALVAEEFALLVLDIQMPGMNGFELAQMVKQRKKTANIPIIFLTAYYSEDQHVLEGYSTGAVDYLHKPINAAVLRSKVAVFAQLHRKTRGKRAGERRAAGGDFRAARGAEATPRFEPGTGTSRGRAHGGAGQKRRGHARGGQAEGRISGPCWGMSCAIRFPRSAMRCAFMTSRPKTPRRGIGPAK